MGTVDIDNDGHKWTLASPAPTVAAIDGIFGTPLVEQVEGWFASDQQKFTYVRYNRSVESMFEKIGGFTRARAALDNLELIPLLQNAGRRYADEHVHLEHLYPRSTGS